MKVGKSYQLLVFLNRRHAFLERIFFGVIAFIGTFLATISLPLALQSWREIMADQFKVALRRCGWYARVSWMRLEFSEDEFFNFTEGLSASVRKAQADFLRRRHRGRHEHVYLSDQLYLIAADVHESIESSQAQTRNLIEEFYRVAALLLEGYPKGACQHHEVVRGAVRQGDFSHEDAAQALADFHALFSPRDWRWYIISGTFLGVVRDNGFLAHDYDIDIGFHAEELDLENFLQQLQSSNLFALTKIDAHCAITQDSHGEYRLVRHPALVKLIHQSGINIDVFLHYKEGSIRWHGSIIHRWNNSDFSLGRYELEGIEVLGPTEASLYLEENYGDWRTPVTDFECSTGTPNLVVTKNFFSLALFLRRLMYFAHVDKVKAEKYADALVASDVLRRVGGGFAVSRYI